MFANKPRAVKPAYLHRRERGRAPKWDLVGEGSRIGPSYSEENKIYGSWLSYNDLVVEMTGKMQNAKKAKTQQFTRRKPNLMKKADQLARLCQADVALIICRGGRYLFIHIDQPIMNGGLLPCQKLYVTI